MSFPLKFVEAGAPEGGGTTGTTGTTGTGLARAVEAAGPGKVYAVHSFRHLGDSVICAGAVHNVKVAHPELMFAYVGHAPEVWENNPDVVHRDIPPPDVYLPRLHYGSTELERTAARGTVVEGFTATLCDLLGIPPVPASTRAPYAVLSDAEKERALSWRGAVLLNANGQTSSFSKFYPHWQEVVDALRGEFPIIQVGSRERRNISIDLKGVDDWRGRTENLRELMVMAAGCAGILSPPSGLVNLAAAFGQRGVVVNGARELAALTAYPGMVHVSMEYTPCNSGKDWACIALHETGNRSCRRPIMVWELDERRCAECMADLDPLAIAEAARKVLRAGWKP